MNAIATIREHMQVLGSDGTLVGVVDHMDGKDKIKLTRNDSADGQHHFIDAGLVDHVDDSVHLSKTAAEVMGERTSEEALDLEEDEAGIADIEQSAAQKQKEWTERRR
jgi:hypothetical protein